MIPTPTDAALALSGSPELSLLVKATVVMAIGLAAARLARTARASVRHLVLAATLAALVALPFAAATGMTIPIEVPAPAETAASPAPPAGADPAGAQAVPPASAATSGAGSVGAPISLQDLARAFWLAGAALLLTQLALTLWRLRRLRRTALPWPDMHHAVRSLAADAGVDAPVEVALHEEVASPLTFGSRQPLILLPPDARDWAEPDLRRALVHELEHVRRRDWALQTGARAVCAAWWFHPLVWAVWRQLSLEAERASDDAVIVKEENMDYAEQLVSLAERLTAARAQPTLGMANRSDLSARVSSLLDGSRRRGRPGRAAIAAAAAVPLLLVLTIAPLRAVARPVTEIRAADPAAPPSQGRVGQALGRELYEAALEGDLAGMTGLIRAGADVNAVIDGDGSPLIAAVRSGDERAILLLLSHGADPNLGVEGDGSPLIAAAGRGRVRLVTLLLDRGARVDQAVRGDENPLIAAAAEGHLDVVRTLVSRGADVNARVWSGGSYSSGREEWRTPLGVARREGHDAIVAFLLASGARDREER